MELIKADPDGRIEIPGVPGLVRRPVNIDRSRTGFEDLRSFRVYRFDAGSTIDGHAEEDEVFVVVMGGAIEFTVSGDNSGEGSRTFSLSAASDTHPDPWVAYLPPHSAYQLIPKTDAEIAYARSTPTGGRPSAVFAPHGRTGTAGITVLLEEEDYAQRLRLRLVHINADEKDVDLPPIPESHAMHEALIHVRTVPAEGVATITSVEGGPIPLDSWDTVAALPGDRPTLRFSRRSSALVLAVSAI